MIIITDEILHLYYINKDKLDKDILNQIEVELKISEDLKLRLDKMEFFCKEYENIKLENCIILHPLDFGNKNVQKYIKLAANSETEKDEYSYVKTYASDENLVLIRIYKNPVLHSSKLYLIADDMDKIANIKIKFPEIELEAVTDEEGIVEILNADIENLNTIEIERK